MKLEKIVRYLSALTGNRWVYCLLVLLPLKGYTQQFEIKCENCNLSDVLMQISQKYELKFAFDASKLSNIPAPQSAYGKSPDELIKSLLLGTSLTYQFKYGRFLIYSEELKTEKNKVPQCQIVGTVSDAYSGEQLPYATVLDMDNKLSTASSTNGVFVLKNIFENPAHIRISYIGYQVIDTLIHWAEGALNISFQLNRKVELIDSVNVKGAKLEMVEFRNDVDFATTINPTKLTDLPVVVETDIFKTLQLLPGISYTSNSSELSIRGGSSDQNLVLFDGQTLYNLSHYYGVVSVLNPNVIKDIQVYKGGYDSRFGERVSGIVDITAKSGNITKPLIYGDLNLVCGNVTAEIPIGRRFTLVAAYRSSYSDIYKTSLSNFLQENRPQTYRRDTVQGLYYQTKPKFYFYDYNFKATYRITDKESVSFNYFGSHDNYDNSYDGSVENMDISTVDKNFWNNYGASLNWQKQWNDVYYSVLQAGTSGYSNTYENSTVVTNEDTSGPKNPYLPDVVNHFTNSNTNEITDVSIAYKNIWYVNSRHQLNAGILLRNNTVFYNKEAEKVYVYDNLNQSAWFTSFYFQDRLFLTQKLVIKPGLRLNYYGADKKLYFEPRIAANYNFSDKFSTRIAAGRYYQFISQVVSQEETGYNKNFWLLANGAQHPVLESSHFIAGTTFEKDKLVLDAEVYYKSFNGLQEYVYISPLRKNSDFNNYFPGNNQNLPGPKSMTKATLAGQQPPKQKPGYYFVGTGKAYGLDMFVRYKSKIFTSWLSYSLGKSIHVFDSINNGADLPAPTDQRHQLSFTQMLNLHKWNLSATTLYATGRPYVDNSASSQVISTQRTYKRLPDYFRTDVSANYNFHINNLRLKVGVTLVNIFNINNYFDVSTRKFDFESTSFAETNLIESQKLSLNFYLHFSL